MTCKSEELNIALENMEKWNWTEGSTHVLYYTPDCDLGFWYKNLKDSSIELGGLDNATPLERSNMLLKLRETILDQSNHGMIVTAPPSIAFYPHNTFFAVGLFLTLVWMIGMAGTWFIRHGL